jgi:RND superfamily putative drug exporter
MTSPRISASAAPSSFFQRWGAFVTRRKWPVLGVSVAVLASAIVSAALFGGSFTTKFSIPGSESQKAADLLTAHFPQQSGASARIVFRSDAPITDEAVRTRIEGVLAQAAALPGVSDVSSPYQQTNAVAADGRTAYATVQFPVDDSTTASSANQLMKHVEASAGNGLVVEAGGAIIEHHERQGLGSTELIGIGAAAIILLIAFGSIVAMGVPIVTALFGLGGSLAILTILARFFNMGSFTSSFASMIGLGVGIDYCLLVITRFREQLHGGHTVDESVGIAIDTAGRSVLFAGTVVIIALLGLTIMGIPFVAALGVAAAIVVGLSVLTALILLPALLAIIGKRVDSLGIPFLKSTESGHHESVWFRLSQNIQRHPIWFAAGAAIILITLAIPVLDIETNFTDAGNGPTTLHSRRAYDLLRDGFGPGFNGPLTVAVDVSDGGAERIDGLRTALASSDGVASVGAPRLNAAGDTAVIPVIPTTSPQDGATNTLVHHLRDDVIPAATRGTAMHAYVGGQTASTLDVADKINSRLPLFFAMVIGLSFFVLMIVFRSIAVPVKAAIMNLLSIGASYGAIVAVFQWGWLAPLLGIHQTGPIEVFLPMMMFAIVFGLSMDYEVFLVSRIREEYLHDGDNAKAVSMGLASTARVITSAALIMIAVFGSFVLGNERVIKEFGLGLAVAIFLDATVVRLMLVPALMEMLGKANWWLPSFLERILPNVSVEGPPRPSALPPLAPAEADAGGEDVRRSA